MKIKIIVRMRGGLGNQLFILAFAYYVASKINSEYEIVLDDREYKYYKIRKFEILDLIENENIRMYDSNMDHSILYDISREIYHVVQKVLPSNKGLAKCLMKKGLFYSKRSGRNVEEISCDRVYLYGYFQDSFVTDKIKNEILRQVNEKESEYEFLSDFKYIAVSVRCGDDYRKQGWPICDSTYFEKGINYILEKKYLNKKVKILMFADDMIIAKKMRLAINVEYVEGCTPVQQLLIMSKCHDFVISNSSFSWWGAYMGNKKDSIVVMPKLWYAPAVKTEDTLMRFDNSVIL